MSDKKIKKRLRVVASYPLSPHMQRIEFTSDDMQYFSQDSAGQYVKLMFTPAGSTDLALLTDGEQPVLRTYTLSAVDVLTKRLTIDFVKHAGLASGGVLSVQSGGHGHCFAEQAQIGDVITIRGPGAIQSVSLSSDWLLLVADMTSIPALSVVLEQLPAKAQGHVVLEVTSGADMPALNLAQNLALTACVRGHGASLSQTVEKLAWLAGQPGVWCACEFSDMKAIRSYVTNEHDVDRAGCYFSSYWKQGVTEDGHRLVKQQDKAALKAES